MALGQPNPIGDFLAGVRVASLQQAGRLALLTLVLERDAAEQLPAAPPWVPLADAIGGGRAGAGVGGRHGRVPSVEVTNTGGVPVLVLFGEEILGAKQNRVANASFLVPAGERLVIDVSCVEQGRWVRRGGKEFTSSDHVVSQALRRSIAGAVTGSRDAGAGFVADQLAVWGEVRERIQVSGACSPRAAYDAYARLRQRDVDAILARLHPVERQVGFVAILDGAVHGLELLGDPRVFAAVFARLVRGYAIDALELDWLRETGRAPGQGPAPRAGRINGASHAAFADADLFVERVARAERAARPSLGLGTDVRLRGGGLAGCALEHEGLVHLVAYPVVPPVADPA